MQYSHSHVYMEDWGVVLNIPNNCGKLFIVRKPNHRLDYPICMYIYNYDWNSNMQIMKIYFELTEKCILINYKQFLPQIQIPVIQDILDCKLKQKPNFSCPLCKTSISNKNIFKIYSLTSECVVCMDKNVELFFKECGHACVCKECCCNLK